MDTCNIKAPYFHSYNRYFMSHMPKHSELLIHIKLHSPAQIEFIFLSAAHQSVYRQLWKNSKNIFIFSGKDGNEIILVFIIILYDTGITYIARSILKMPMFSGRRKIENHKRTKLALHTIAKRNQKSFYRFKYGKITMHR